MRLTETALGSPFGRHDRKNPDVAHWNQYQALDQASRRSGQSVLNSMPLALDVHYRVSKMKSVLFSLPTLTKRGPVELLPGIFFFAPFT